MAVPYIDLFNLAYSTSISESLKSEILESTNLPLFESEITISEDIYESIYFLDELAYSNMSEGLINSIIDDVFEGCSEEYLEEVYEAYVRAKALIYISEGTAPIGLTGLDKELNKIANEKPKRSLFKRVVGGAADKIKGAVDKVSKWANQSAQPSARAQEASKIRDELNQVKASRATQAGATSNQSTEKSPQPESSVKSNPYSLKRKDIIQDLRNKQLPAVVNSNKKLPAVTHNEEPNRSERANGGRELVGANKVLALPAPKKEHAAKSPAETGDKQSEGRGQRLGKVHDMLHDIFKDGVSSDDIKAMKKFKIPKIKKKSQKVTSTAPTDTGNSEVVNTATNGGKTKTPKKPSSKRSKKNDGEQSNKPNEVQLSLLNGEKENQLKSEENGGSGEGSSKAPVATAEAPVKPKKNKRGTSTSASTGTEEGTSTDTSSKTNTPPAPSLTGSSSTVNQVTGDGNSSGNEPNDGSLKKQGKASTPKKQGKASTPKNPDKSVDYEKYNQNLGKNPNEIKIKRLQDQINSKRSFMSASANKPSVRARFPEYEAEIKKWEEEIAELRKKIKS